jgi:hypothetical protein
MWLWHQLPAVLHAIADRQVYSLNVLDGHHIMSATCVGYSRPYFGLQENQKEGHCKQLSTVTGARVLRVTTDELATGQAAAGTYGTLADVVQMVSAVLGGCWH